MSLDAPLLSIRDLQTIFTLSSYCPDMRERKRAGIASTAFGLGEPEALTPKGDKLGDGATGCVRRKLGRE